MADFEEKLLLSRLADLEQRAEHGSVPCFSRFLDPREILLFTQKMRPHLPFLLWGGYAEAERQMLGFFPKGCEPDFALFPLSALRLSGGENPGHRTVLGSLMALGIERNLLGDIAMEAGGPVLFACSSISEYLCLNLTRVGRHKVFLTETPAEDLSVLPKAWEEISGTVASLRLDCVLGLLTGASRTKTEELLRQEMVNLNYSLCKKGSVTLSAGDVLSVRKFGRAELIEVLGETKKGRIRIVLKKYI